MMKISRTKPIQLFLILLVTSLVFQACDSSTSPGNGEDQMSPPDDMAEPNLCDDTYPCENINLLANLTPQQLQGEALNDIWGWTDPQTGREYALVGMTDRVTFVDISTPTDPQVVGTLPESVDESQTSESLLLQMHDDEDGEGKSAWRDVKVYQNYAYVVSDGQPHGLQVFDLTRLRDVTNTPQTFSEDLHYTEFGNAHNIAINEESGFAYVVGSNQAGGGLFILDLSDPSQPVHVGSHTDPQVGRNSTGYVHDTQCVMYNGPDVDYAGQEVCFNSSETHLMIADVTDKQNTSTISRNTYSGNEYAHQGWLTDDQRYFLLDDELDESRRGTQTTTYIWDVQDLDNPEMIGTYQSGRSIDHNQYINNGYTYQANYTRGLRVIDIANISEGALEEVGYFDTHPASDAPTFDGAWSVYPYFDSGVIVVSDISNGLFILSSDL